MSKKTTSLVFTGDIGFSRYMDKRWEGEGLLSPSILAFLHSGDHVVANVEGALMEAVNDGSRGIFFHSMNPAAVTVLEKMHADIWNISNNHIMDAGREGLVNTRKMAHDRGCRTIGAGTNLNEASEPVFLDEAGGIGMFGVAYMAECIPATATNPGVFPWNEMELIKKRISKIKEKCRWCIVVAHGGEEFADLPNPYTRDRYVEYLNMGADIVVAHHPHVTENYELFDDGKAIFYSLGNFIFDTDYQRAHPYTDRGVLLKLSLNESEMTFDAIGIQIVRGPEYIEEAPLPDIFTNIPADEFALLSPLAAKAFLKEENEKMIFMEPERFTDAPKEVWDAYYFSKEPDGYDEGAHMDLSIIVPYAQTADEEKWKESKLTKVVDYLLSHF